KLIKTHMQYIQQFPILVALLKLKDLQDRQQVNVAHRKIAVKYIPLATSIEILNATSIADRVKQQLYDKTVTSDLANLNQQALLLMFKPYIYNNKQTIYSFYPFYKSDEDYHQIFVLLEFQILNINIQLDTLKCKYLSSIVEF